MATAVIGTRDSGGTPGVRRLRGLRAWFVGFVGWMAGLTALAVFLLARYEAGGPEWLLRAWILALLCFYLSLCNSLVPLPTAWIVLLAATPAYALVPQPVVNVAVVAVLATLATVAANLNEYHVLAYLLRSRWGRRVRQTRLVLWAVRWFDRAPFQILTLVAFLPLPIDAVRWLAILRGYSRWRFAAAYFAGRGPRYLLFAGCAVLLELGPRQILIIQVAIVALALLGRVGWWLARRRAAPTAVAQTTLAAAGESPAAGPPPPAL